MIICDNYSKFIETNKIPKRTFFNWKKDNFRLNKHVKTLIEHDMKFLSKIQNTATAITMTSLFKAYKKASKMKSIANIKRSFKRMARRWLLAVRKHYVYFYTYDMEKAKLVWNLYKTD